MPCGIMLFASVLLCASWQARRKISSSSSRQPFELAKQSFLDTFLNEYGYLYDYVDGKMIDWSVRPNMIFPVAFDYSPLSQDQKKRVLDICTRELPTLRPAFTLTKEWRIQPCLCRSAEPTRLCLSSGYSMAMAGWLLYGGKSEDV